MDTTFYTLLPLFCLFPFFFSLSLCVFPPHSSPAPFLPLEIHSKIKNSWPVLMPSSLGCWGYVLCLQIQSSPFPGRDPFNSSCWNKHAIVRGSILYPRIWQRQCSPRFTVRTGLGLGDARGHWRFQSQKCSCVCSYQSCHCSRTQLDICPAPSTAWWEQSLGRVVRA